MTRCFRVVDLRVSIFIFLILFSISFPCSFQWFVCNERVYSSNANLRYLREGGPRCVRLEFQILVSSKREPNTIGSKLASNMRLPISH